jgi:hypothetical protein
VDDSRRIRDLEALSLLCRELARLGMTFGISDARPAVWVRTNLTDSRVWISVNPSGQLFNWRRDDVDRHPVDDPAGAAAQLFEYLKIREHDDSNGS